MGSTMRRRAAAGVVLAVATASLAACTGDDTTPSTQPDVALSVDGVKDLVLGVVVSSTSAPGEGSDYNNASAGAELAGYRLKLGKTPVTIKVVDDRGESDRAESAVEDLASQGVGGIVLATTGSHVDAALDAASRADLPVVAPYLRAEDVPDGVHLTGPTEEQVTAGLEQALDDDSVSAPTLIATDSVPAPDLSPVETITDPGSDVADTVDDIARAVRAGSTDSVVISAPAETQGALQAGLQGRLPNLPVYLTPEALSPAFAQALDANRGTTSGRLVAVGTGASDASTLGSDAEADSAAAYFAALRLAADDSSFTSSLDGTPFADVAQDADLPSHDAVVALVRAASKAGSTDPAAIGKALSTLTLGARQSIAGPALDLTTSPVLKDTRVVPLRATTQSAGVRPADLSPALTWFVAPRGEG